MAKVLLIEDDITIARLVTLKLEKEGLVKTERLASAMGTFSSRLTGFGAGDTVSLRTATAAEKTAENTKRIITEIKRKSGTTAETDNIN